SSRATSRTTTKAPECTHSDFNRGSFCIGHDVTMRRLSLLGATGSIGASTLDVVAQHPDRFTVAALAAHRNWQKLGELCRRYQPALAVLLDEDAGRALKRDIAVACPRTRVACGAAALSEAATLPDVDTV